MKYHYAFVETTANFKIYIDSFEQISVAIKSIEHMSYFYGVELQGFAKSFWGKQAFKADSVFRL